MDRWNIGIAGCGNIAGGYGGCLEKHPDELRIAGCYDPIAEKMSEFASRFACRTYDDLDQMLNDDDIDLVINLTVHTVHAEVTRKALQANKHVHSEKPLASNRADARDVVDLAAVKELRLGFSPFIILGEAQQTLWKQIRDGRIGKPLVAYAEMNWGRIERWHPDPAGFYGKGAGPLLDVGCYPLNVLTSILGPVVAVTGSAGVLLPYRTVGSGPHAGQTFTPTLPDHAVGSLEFESGVLGRLTCSFLVGPSRQVGIEIHGESGALTIDGVGFSSPVQFAACGAQEWVDVPLLAQPVTTGVDWSRGIREIKQALEQGRPHRCTGEQAYHILDVCLSIIESAEQGRKVSVDSRFDLPAPTIWKADSVLP